MLKLDVLNDTLNKYYGAIINLSESCKKLIFLIETTCEFKPIAMEYQAEWLNLIDCELNSGNRDSGFWRNKIKKR
jgi:hypothetical protein